MDVRNAFPTRPSASIRKATGEVVSKEHVNQGPAQNMIVKQAPPLAVTLLPFLTFHHFRLRLTSRAALQHLTSAPRIYFFTGSL